ncbi:MAG: hypothetical protein V1908_00310 [Candidatus Peregrinibacteria bacterium]
MSQLPLMEELVPVREAQKNITKYFEKGIARVTKNGRSLGYLISDKKFDEMMDEMKEKIEESNPAFIAEMEALAKKSKKEKGVPLEQVAKKLGIKI